MAARSQSHAPDGVLGLASVNIWMPASTIVGSSIALPSRCRFNIDR